MSANPEFNLYVWKQRSEGDRPDRYTIGVWVKDHIQPLCHIQPLDEAVAVIRTFLATVGASWATGEITVVSNTART